MRDYSESVDVIYEMLVDASDSVNLVSNVQVYLKTHRPSCVDISGALSAFKDRIALFR